MNEKFILSVILLINFLYVSAYKQNSCKLKMASSKMSIFKGDKVIYNEGTLDEERFGKNAHNPYLISADEEIDYFYILENKLANKNNHDKIQISSTSTDTSILNIKSTISTENSEYTDTFDMSAIEVVYTCLENKSGKVKLEMTITSDHCDPFTIYWLKECKIKSPPPHINIGVTYSGEELMKEGKFNNGIKINDPNIKFPISKSSSTFEIFLSNPKANEKHISMKEPTIIYNEENLTTLFRGQLVKGGTLTTTPQSLSVIFACSPLNKSATDVQITLHFTDNSYVNLFFTKECNTVEEIQEYFTVLYVIYWILILLIIMFIVVIFFYYLKKNELTLMEFYDKIRDYAIYKYESYKSRRMNNESESRSLVNRQFVDEDDLDIKITTANPVINDQNRNNSKQTTIEYGGL